MKKEFYFELKTLFNHILTQFMFSRKRMKGIMTNFTKIHKTLLMVYLIKIPSCYCFILLSKITKPKGHRTHH